MNPGLQAPGFIRELSLILFGRWEPDGLFMLFTAYVDESDTHGPEPHMVMGATLATARKWEIFDKGFRKLQRKYGFKVLHGVDFRNEDGEFANWPDGAHKGLLDDLGRLVNRCAKETITVSLKHSVYRQHFLDVRPQKMHATSQYGICFETILRYFMGFILGEYGQGHRLSVVVEDGHDNAPDTARIFKKYKADFVASGIDLLRTHSLVSKEDSRPLMAIDMGVYGTSRLNRAVRAGTHKRSKHPQPEKGQPGWLSIELGPDDLKAIIDTFTKDREQAHADFLKRREAWRARKDGAL